MSELPLGWCHVTFDNVIETITNGVNGKQNKDGIGLPVSRIETIANQSIDMERIGFVSDYVEENFEKYRLNEGDILFSHINSPSHLGKTALCGKNIKLFHGVNLLRIVVNGAVTPEFFNFYCKYIRGVGEFSLKAQHAVNQSSLNQQKLKQFILPISPLNEQIRIANKLHSVLAKVDAAQASLEKIPTLLKRFRQSVLAAATSGELTKEWRIENSIEISSWVALTLGDIAEVFTGVTPLKKEIAYYENGTIPWLTSSVTGKNLVTESENYVTEKAVKECRLKLFNPGTLLIAMYGEGKTRGQVTEIAIAATINQACAAVIVNNQLVDNKYVRLSIENNYERTRMMAEGGNQPNLNLSKVRSIAISLPSKSEQTEIVRRVESLFALADTVEKQYLAAKQRLDRLSQSILAKAFRGELVPQDPNDEPAAELLKRIQAERQAQPPANRKRSKPA